MDKILAVIPARSGSKSIIDKNIQPIFGKPMLAYSIEQARESSKINRVILSTDCKKYAEIGAHYGAEVPFLRPKEISGDLSTDFELFNHILNNLWEVESYVPDLIVHLRPTYPVRSVVDIDNCIEVLIHRPEFDSLRSVSEFEETPFKMWFRDSDGSLQQVTSDNKFPESHSSPRQNLPRAYLQNASIDVIRPKTILEKKSMVGDRVYGYTMGHNYDIDFNSDIERVKSVLKLNKREYHPLTFCFDIDGVIATITEDNDYKLAKPILENIEIINYLHKKGNRIILNTARGFISGIDWKQVTEDQLSDWGVMYHNLMIGSKPAADFYIDDRFIDIEILKKMKI